MEKVDVLTVAAHPDDVELTCAGTLIKMVDKGYSVGILDLTEGEMGTRGTPELRAQEAEAARGAIGALFRERLNFGDSRLTASIENRFALAEQIRAARPKTVILPYWEGRHPDHYTAATLGYEACYRGTKTIARRRSAYRLKDPLCLVYWEVKPSFLVDISPQWGEDRLINCFASQFAGDSVVSQALSGRPSSSTITTQCKYFGH